MTRRPLSLALSVAFLTSLIALETGNTEVLYPKSKKVDHVDTYHGHKVADPYRWLEDDVRESDEVADWVKKQNAVTFKYLETFDEREAIQKRLTELWNYERFSTPKKAGRYYLMSRNDGLQNQDVLYIMDTPDSEPRVLIDPNSWSDDGTVSLATWAVSDDGAHIAYGVAEAGSDWLTFRVLEIATGKVLPDEIRWVKFSGATWTPDGKGFFYGRYDEPKEGTEYQGLNLGQKIYYHRPGTPQSADILAYERPDHPDWGFGTDVTDDGRYLVLTVWKGTDSRYQVYVKDLAEPIGIPTALIGNFDHEYTYIANDGSRLLFQTNLDAPKRRLVAFDMESPEAGWKEVIAETDDTLVGVDFVGNLLIASYLEDAKSLVRVYDLKGQHLRDVDLPGIGSASGFAGKRTDTETFYSFSSFDTPPSLYRYDVVTGGSKLLRRTEVDMDPDDYEVRQVFYESKDGTKVPMFIAHRAGLELTGDQPTLLYGYGGFDIPLTPSFSVQRLAWMEMGGVFAMPNLRGGGEYGEPWHKAGTKLQKQNVFDDFIAAAEWLIDNDYTRSDRLAVSGRSNGGLLVGAVMTQRPELFGAALPGVGVMDMLRFQHFTAGRFWVDDYGSSDDPEEFKALLAYSPYHNLKPGTDYPSTMVTTADTDDRVVPGHSFKFAAALQEAHKGDAPVLIRIETRAGHGAGKPTSMIIEQVADEWAFLINELGVNDEASDVRSIEFAGSQPISTGAKDAASDTQ